MLGNDGAVRHPSYRCSVHRTDGPEDNEAAGVEVAQCARVEYFRVKSRPLNVAGSRKSERGTNDQVES